MDNEELYIKNRLNGYGITRSDFSKLIKMNDGSCHLCDKPLVLRREHGTTEEPFVCLDHDHHTTKVRGLLCTSCNLSLGFYEKRPVTKRTDERRNEYLIREQWGSGYVGFDSWGKALTPAKERIEVAKKTKEEAQALADSLKRRSVVSAQAALKLRNKIDALKAARGS